MFITAFIVDEDEACIALAADISEHVHAASVNVDVALTLEQMVMGDTLKT